ncbi:MAG: serine protease [Sphingomonadaceae bacterium]|nr:serine protease [Sphingomonadaceae bacterium]
MLRLFLTAVFALSPTMLCAEPPPVEERWDARPAARGDVLLRQAMLGEHNAARAAYGVRPLAWSDALAADARGYAAVLARTGRFAHDPQANARVQEGENLFTGTRSAYRYEEMADAWIDERADYRPGEFPEVSATGDWSDVGHYTQIVWPGTTEVGCALASNARDDYLVCRYLPAGNVVGEVMR